MISRIMITGMMYCSLPVTRRLVLAPRAFNKIWTSSDKIMIKRLSE
jgi:hypothetical protein